MKPIARPLAAIGLVAALWLPAGLAVGQAL